ncbi:MAG: hypothetical protein JWO96_665 [Candidatus Saccharibacteria bacterium]|nr:hypothetical protein [Candidatus Saccharibacteria bacterium]
MPQKIFIVEDLGEVLVAKRRGTKNIRLSITADGSVRVGIPAWVPYSAGLTFAKSRQEWITKHRVAARPGLKSGDRIGKSYRLNVVVSPSERISTRLSTNEIIIKSPQPVDTARLQSAITKAAERALRSEASKLLPGRTAQLAEKYGYDFRQVVIKKLTSRWGSCSSDKIITLNFFLMQLPWELIDYVILHELVHTKHLNHGKAFWDDLKTAIPDARARQKLVKSYHPVIMPS